MNNDHSTTCIWRELVSFVVKLNFLPLATFLGLICIWSAFVMRGVHGVHLISMLSKGVWYDLVCKIEARRSLDGELYLLLYLLYLLYQQYCTRWLYWKFVHERTRRNMTHVACVREDRRTSFDSATLRNATHDTLYFSFPEPPIPHGRVTIFIKAPRQKAYIFQSISYASIGVLSNEKGIRGHRERGFASGACPSQQFVLLAAHPLKTSAARQRNSASRALTSPSVSLSRRPAQ